jgi:hypothetical protein
VNNTGLRSLRPCTPRSRTGSGTEGQAAIELQPSVLELTDNLLRPRHNRPAHPPWLPTQQTHPFSRSSGPRAMSSSKVTPSATPASQLLTSVDPPKFDLESYISNYHGTLPTPQKVIRRL